MFDNCGWTLVFNVLRYLSLLLNFTFILTALNIIAFPSSIALRSNAKHGKSRKKSKAGKATKSKYKFHKSYSSEIRKYLTSNTSLHM